MADKYDMLKSVAWVGTIGLIIVTTIVGCMLVGVFLEKRLDIKGLSLVMTILGILAGLGAAYRLLVKVGGKR
jgi:hypothetical protein